MLQTIPSSCSQAQQSGAPWTKKLVISQSGTQKVTSPVHKWELKAGVSFCDSCPMPQNVTDHETLDAKVC